MTIGYLHVGEATHGVSRYGRLLADATREHTDGTVQKAEVVFDDKPSDNAARLRRAADALAEADLIHLQYNERVWGESQKALRYLRAFVSHCRPPLVATLHDVRSGYGWMAIAQRLWRERSMARSFRTPRSRQNETDSSALKERLLASMGRALSFVTDERQNERTTRWLGSRAARVLVCTEEEARRAQEVIPSERLAVVPHFVETRQFDMTKKQAKTALGLDGQRVITVLGFIHARKGHDLVVEALPQLSNDVRAVFAGEPGRDSPHYANHLHARADQLGVTSRMQITGYLPEAQLNQYLAATDLALCPFRQVSASGTLATWIGADRPILASETSLVDEYNARADNAIATFSPLTGDALARQIRRLLTEDTSPQHAALDRLRAQLDLPATAQRHMDQYRDVVRRTAADGQSYTSYEN